MLSIRSFPLPDNALLARYRDSDAYADCYTTELPGVVSQAEFVAAFYTSWVFKLERWILRWAVAKPSSDAEAEQLATGAMAAFAAWTMEDRNEQQLLMCDFMGRTRSWLMVAPEAAQTRLYFGSAVVPVEDAKTGAAKRGFVFTALLGFHKLYSIVLLHAARSKLAALRAQRHNKSL